MNEIADSFFEVNDLGLLFMHLHKKGCYES